MTSLSWQQREKFGEMTNFLAPQVCGELNAALNCFEEGMLVEECYI
jgi:hypothetical protein